MNECQHPPHEHLSAETIDALDAGIREYVVRLDEGGVETFESCQGGDGHAFLEPTVRFHGQASAGFHALSVAMTYALPVASLKRTWVMTAGEPTGPYWEIVFTREAG